jgi:hypothetical protein
MISYQYILHFSPYTLSHLLSVPKVCPGYSFQKHVPPEVWMNISGYSKRFEWGLFKECDAVCKGKRKEILLLI